MTLIAEKGNTEIFQLETNGLDDGRFQSRNEFRTYHWGCWIDQTSIDSRAISMLQKEFREKFCRYLTTDRRRWMGFTREDDSFRSKVIVECAHIDPENHFQ